MDEELKQLAIHLNQRLIERGLSMASAESCTGGWIAKAMTDIPGSSGCFERAFITYSNAAKQEMLGVDPVTLDGHGAVSEQVVKEMVQGALDHSHASVAVAVSGIAGPDGGSEDKPVGTVWLAWVGKGMDIIVSREHFSGDREAVRYRSTMVALQGVLNLIE
ncbi:MAG: nicotinamide-nucleotide amidase [Gammaproteobacteria bacterium]|nr:nicotinamide-nucleotide amidase [Gammaproteobacteria bacterium]